MRLSVTSGQMICIFCIAMFVSGCVLGAYANDAKIPTCCPSVSKFEVKDPIEFCAHVPAKRRGRKYCSEAYILLAGGKGHCIDVTAPWINETLENLKQNNNTCKGTPQ